MAARLRDLDAVPTRVEIAWQLCLNAEITLFDHRTREIKNFLKAVEASVLRPL